MNVGAFYFNRKIELDFDLSKLVKNPGVKQAQGDLTRYYSSRKSPTSYYNRAMNDLGVPDARARVASDRKAIADTQNLLEAVEPSVTGRTQGGLVTEAQRTALVNKERAPITQDLGNLSRVYSTSSSNLADLMGQADMRAQLGIQGDQNTLAALMQRLDQARYGQEARRQNRLDALNERLQLAQLKLQQQQAAAANRSSSAYDRMFNLMTQERQQADAEMAAQQAQFDKDRAARQKAAKQYQRSGMARADTANQRARIMRNRRKDLDNSFMGKWIQTPLGGGMERVGSWLNPFR